MDLFPSSITINSARIVTLSLPVSLLLLPLLLQVLRLSVMFLVRMVVVDGDGSEEENLVPSNAVAALCCLQEASECKLSFKSKICILLYA